MLISAVALVAGVSALDQNVYDEQAAAPVPQLEEGQYQGVCVVVTPPDPDPCDAVSGSLRYGFLGELVNVPYLGKWRQANPGEVIRLNQIMQAPACSIASNPQPQIMRTRFGSALSSVMEAIACARRPEAILWPAAVPPPTGLGGDRTPPTAPGPITVTPGG